MKLVFNKGSASNTWEPHPWDANWFKAKKQKLDFQICATRSLNWQKFSVEKFEKSRLWGKDAKEFGVLNLEYISEDEDCRYMLMENYWFGFPDPPKWRLAFSGQNDSSKWKDCGYFYEMPECWRFLNCKHPNEQT